MKNADAPVELQGLLKPDDAAEWVSNLWVKWDNQRQPIKSHWQQVDEYIYSVDTSTTENSSLPWTHKARNSKITNIRDNLHSNYLSSLFPNDKWLTWNAYSKDAARRDKAKTITSYMDNKAREGGFRDKMSELLYDYIDRGMCFAMPTFEARYKTTDTERVTSFIGPTCVRISPNDIVFNPTADNFRNSPKVVRTMTTLGALAKMAETHPDQTWWKDILDRRMLLHQAAMTYSADDWEKTLRYSIDGFGNLQEYYISDTVEILEFYGDFHNARTGELEQDRMITIVDRSFLARNEEINTYDGKDPIRSTGWRKRPGNLWSQGPLDLLLGMQYQLDHYLNMAANALDLKVMPPIKVIGNVEEFSWQPREEIHIDENGDVQEMAQQFGDIQACLTFIAELENRMEMYAGAPREAMGIRTPGEKTAFEVQALENAAGRIFQEKITQFEVFMEDILNGMLEEAHRNFPITDIVRIMDDDIGATEFREITKEDITADGVLRPIGARHFAQKAQELQNLVGVFNSPIGQMIAPHTSSQEMARFIEDVVDLRGYNMFRPNVAIAEQAETQQLAGQIEEEMLNTEQIDPEAIEQGGPVQ